MRLLSAASSTHLHDHGLGRTAGLPWLHERLSHLPTLQLERKGVEPLQRALLLALAPATHTAHLAHRRNKSLLSSDQARTTKVL